MGGKTEKVIGWACHRTIGTPVAFHNQHSNREMAAANDHDFLELAEASPGSWVRARGTGVCCAG